jgi:hypothetical protein
MNAASIEGPAEVHSFRQQLALIRELRSDGNDSMGTDQALRLLSALRGAVEGARRRRALARRH